MEWQRTRFSSPRWCKIEWRANHKSLFTAFIHKQTNISKRRDDSGNSKTPISDLNTSSKPKIKSMNLFSFIRLFLLMALSSMTMLESKVYESVKRVPAFGECRTIKYDYTIKVDGCLPKTIKMKMCGGGCSSRISPHGSYCSRCYPSSIRNATTTLECPFSEDGELVKTVTYLKLKKCNCRKVECVKWKPEERLGFARIKFMV